MHSQASAALRIAVHLDRNEFGRRYLQSIAVVRRRNAVGPVQATLAVTFDQGGQTRQWPGYPQLCDELGLPAPLEAPLAPRNLEHDLICSTLPDTPLPFPAPRPPATQPGQAADPTAPQRFSASESAVPPPAPASDPTAPSPAPHPDPAASPPASDLHSAASFNDEES